MDGPDATITLTTEPLALQGSSHIVRATFTGHTATSGEMPLTPERVRLVLSYESVSPPVRRTVELGTNRPSASVRVLPDGLVFATFVPALAGALRVRVQGTVLLDGVFLEKAAETRLYVRRSAAAA